MKDIRALLGIHAGDGVPAIGMLPFLPLHPLPGRLLTRDALPFSTQYYCCSSSSELTQIPRDARASTSVANVKISRVMHIVARFPLNSKCKVDKDWHVSYPCQR